MKRIYFTLVLGLVAQLVNAQRPIVSGFDKQSAAVGESIIISGSGFPTTVGDVLVHLGSGKASVISTSNSEIIATVPASATYGSISVTNTATNLTGVSSQTFFLSYGGRDFLTSSLDALSDFNTDEQYSYDLCNCDFNNDGLLDVAVANNNSRDVSIFQNVSTPTSTSFIKYTGLVGINASLKPINTISTECSDLNGDGLPDLAFVSEENASTQIFIYQNNSSGTNISFTPLTPFAIPRLTDGSVRTAREFKLRDLDLDGKPDLIVSQTQDNILYIFRNTSSAALISMEVTPIELTITNLPETGIIDVADLDNDQLPEIITGAFTVSNERITILRNVSSAGNINFNAPEVINSSGSYRDIITADLNNDGLLDIAATKLNTLLIAMNSGSSRNYSFEDMGLQNIPLQGAFGLTAGDLNGDGTLDLAVTSSSSDSLYTLLNDGNASPSFDVTTIPTDDPTRNVEIADYNGDAKPDLGFIHRSQENALGFFSVIINRNCIDPVISPSGLTFCIGSPFTLEATNSISSTYNWTSTDDVNEQSRTGNQATLVVNSGTSATITVTINSDDASCNTSSSETFSLIGGSQPAAPTITNSATGVICAGTDFSISGPAGQEEYLWTLNDETILTDQSINFNNVTTAEQGIYSLRVKPPGQCYSPPTTINISVDQPPAISINNAGSDLICAGTNTTLQVPDYAGYSYQWQQNGTNIGTDSNIFLASSTGDYTSTITSEATGCDFTAVPVSISRYALPTPNIIASDEFCVNLEATFDATGSTGEAAATLNYTWDFGDGTNDAGPAPTHIFTSTGSFTTVLTVGYDELSGCTANASLGVTISEAPSAADILADVTPNPETTPKCPEDALTLTLPGTYPSVTWSFNEEEITANTAAITTDNNQDDVQVTVDVITDIGCNVTGTTFVVSNLEGSGFDFSSPNGSIVNDSLEMSETATSVILNVSNGANFIWSPADLLDNINGTSVTVFPRSRFSTVSVTGTDNAGCSNTSNITIVSPGVIPRKSFSPNGDNIGYECWEILNSDAIQECTVFIYDEKGSLVFEGNSPFVENCVWNGNINNGNTQAPKGVYYFVFKCEDASISTTGTILLAR